MTSTSSQTEPQPVIPPASAGKRLSGWALASVLAGLMLTLLLSALDQTIVGTALPKIIGDLHGFDRYTWVVTAYLLASTTVIPIVGKLSDQFGRKWLLIGGIVIFLAGSVLSGASQAINQLIVFRGLQGLGAGFLMTLVITSVGDIFSPAERARWQGLFSGVLALASVIGPTVGGLITDHATWRWVFYINLPIAMLALIALVIWLPSSISVRSTRYRGWSAVRRIDFIGALTAAAATICLLLGLTWGGSTYPWASTQVIGMLSAAGVLYIVFVINERFAIEPILPLDLFRNQIFTAGALLSLTVGFALFGAIIYLPLFIQAVLGQTATSSGAATTPLMVTLAIGAVLVGFLIARVGRYQIFSIIGAVILTIGMFLLSRMGTMTTLAEVTLNMVVIGAGMGMLQPVMSLAVQNAILRERLGVGTGAVSYLRSTGATIGTAVLGTVVANVAASELPSQLPAAASKLPSSVLALATNQQVLVNSDAQHMLIRQAVQQTAARLPPGPAHAQQIAALTNQVTHMFQQIFMAGRLSLGDGIHTAFLLATGVCLATVIITLFLKDVPLRKREEGVPEQQAIPIEA